MIKQISVFLENDKGRLAALCRCLADAGVNMSALSIADTPEYGLVRIVCNEADKAKALDNADISVEYGYCFSHQDGNAIFALKVTDSAQAAEAVFAIERAGFQILEEGELD